MIEMRDREFHSRNGKLKKTFVPTGGVVTRGRRTRALMENPVRWSSDDPPQAARLFVGMSVGMQPRWTMQDLVNFVREIRTEQTGDPSASFIAQKGIYVHAGGGPVVEEDAAQVIILNLGETPSSAFEQQMVQLAEKLATDMQQEEVIVEMQRGGAVQKTIGVGAAA